MPNACTQIDTCRHTYDNKSLRLLSGPFTFKPYIYSFPAQGKGSRSEETKRNRSS